MGKTFTAAPLITDTFILHPVKNTMNNTTIKTELVVFSKTMPAAPEENSVTTKIENEKFN